MTWPMRGKRKDWEGTGPEHYLSRATAQWCGRRRESGRRGHQWMWQLGGSDDGDGGGGGGGGRDDDSAGGGYEGGAAPLPDGAVRQLSFGGSHVRLSSCEQAMRDAKVEGDADADRFASSP